MADGQSMTTQELVRRTLLDEHGDFLKEAVAMVVARLMEAEITAEIGAARGEVSAERVTHRNGYRPRAWETRVGEIELQIPRKRSGEAYFPSFLFGNLLQVPWVVSPGWQGWAEVAECEHRERDRRVG
jgi:transposase-like protein